MGCAGGRLIRHPAPWRRLEARQHAGGDQQLIGFSVKLVGTTEYVTIEQFENDQLDLERYPR
jgi:hypothetical protein